MSDSYFDTIGTPLTDGRTFQPTDNASSTPVVILSKSMARYYFKKDSPIGRRSSWRLFNGNWSTPADIVGVAADSRADGIEPADPPTIALAAVLLVAVAVGAAWVPARRATAVDPIAALRGD